jgi:hypothetical protein
MTAQWYYWKDGQPVGPVSAQTMRQLIGSGQLGPADVLQREGSPHAVAVREAREFYPAPASRAAARPARVPTAELVTEWQEARPGPAAAPVNALLWTVATAVPVLGAAAWLVAATRGRGARYALHAVLYAVWPVIGLVIAAVFVAMVQARAVSSSMVGGYAVFLWCIMWVASVVHARREWNALEAAEEPGPAGPRQKALLLAYSLWLTLGWAGAHRFYAGRWVTGLLYACSFGLFGLGWAADMFLLFDLFAKADHEAPDATDEEELLEAIAVAPWALQLGAFGSVEFALRLVFFLVTPALFVMVAMMMNRMELVLLMVVVVVACGLMENFQRTLGQFETLKKVPPLGGALEKSLARFKELHAFYFEHKPRSFLFYLFYPVTCPLACLVSPTRRQEAKLYLRMVVLVVGAVLFEQARGYFSTYPPHLTARDAAVFIFCVSVISILIMAVFMIPMITTSFYLNLSGQQSKLKPMMVLGLVCALPFAVYLYYQQSFHISFLSEQLLDQRLTKASFRDELREISSMFLAYHARHWPDGADGQFGEHEELTRKYRRHIASVALHNEANAFRVFTFPAGSSRASKPWCGVLVRHSLTSQPAWLLFVMSPDGRVHASWNTLPGEVQDYFHVVDHVNTREQEDRFDLIGARALIDDLP